MFFFVFELVPTPTSSCLVPRCWALCGAACVSFAIRPSSVQLRAAASSPARDPFALPSSSSALRPDRRKSESATEKPVQQARAAAVQARLRSSPGTFPLCGPLEFLRPGNELGSDRQLVGCKLHGFGRRRQIHAGHLKHDAPRFHDRHPVFRWTLALAHARFGRFLSERLVWKTTDTEFAAALDETRDCDARRFDLAIGDPGRFHGLESVVAKRQRAAAPRLSSAPAALLLAVLHLLRHQHNG